VFRGADIRSAKAAARRVRRPEGVGDTRYVFVDHTIACPTNTGVQRVVRGVAKDLVDGGSRVVFVKWDPKTAGCVRINVAERTYLGQWNGPALSAGDVDFYAPAGAPAVPIKVAANSGSWLLVPEVTHITFQSEPVTARLIAWARAVDLGIQFIYYDAIPLRRPEFAEIAARHAQYMRDLCAADAIWPISRWSADELASFWRAGRDADNAHLPIIRPLHLPAQFDQRRIVDVQPGEKLILSVGTLEPRKNQIALIRAFQEFLSEHPDSGWRLVLVGNLHPVVADDIRAATRPDSAIQFREHVSDLELTDLYQRCAFTVFPSIDEGFGLPILESLWHAKPCICANFGAMSEVASGGGCLEVDVRDHGSLKSALERLIDDAELRQSLSRDAVNRQMTQWSDYLNEIYVRGAAAEPLIFFWVDATISFPTNTGIQRVARQLARGLIESGFRLVPVKWGSLDEPFHPVSVEELTHFAAWNGPPVDGWNCWIAPECHRGAGWFLMSELPLNLSAAEQEAVRRTAEVSKLKTAAVFYDTVPWKMRDIYPKPFYTAHLSYMRELSFYSVVLPISKYSRNEYVNVLMQEFRLTRPSLGHVLACTLPGEFPELPRQNVTRFSDKNEQIQILSVGTVEPRKNHELLLDAFELARRRSGTPLRLTIVGGGHSIDPGLAERVRARIKDDPQVAWEEGADDARIGQLYGECDFTVYPSVEEGFGIPILESLWHGKPVICADFGAMLEVAAEGGGCITINVRDAEALATTIVELANTPLSRERLAEEARTRERRSWREYSENVAAHLGLWTHPTREVVETHREAMQLMQRPKLSVCISTYNRAEWLTIGLKQFADAYPAPIDGVELVICDDASTDHTPDVVSPYLARPDFSYRRNLLNVGMLENLRETVQAAGGEYIWVLGDDDLLRPGAIERALQAIGTSPAPSLVYVNYAYTNVTDARTVTDFDRFFVDAIPIVPPEGDLIGPIREICAQNENFFTAIYTLILRRDHALAAYSQDTSGRPFSTMLTCIPTTYYVFNHMMDEMGVWIGDPQIVVNMNVSWKRFAPLWILERIPEVYEVARQKGVAAENIDRWRRHTLPIVAYHFADIFADDPLNNAEYFSAKRLIRRFSDLPEFETYRSDLLDIYTRAHEDGHRSASEPPDAVFGEVRQPLPKA